MKIKVGLLGMGNVGTGTYKTLDMNREKIFDSTGLDIEITKVLVNDTSKDRGIKLPSEKLTQNPDDIFLDKNIDIVVELIGGIEPASEFIQCFYRFFFDKICVLFLLLIISGLCNINAIYYRLFANKYRK